MAAEGNLFASLVVGHLAISNAATPELQGAELFGRMYAGPLLLAFAQWVEHLRKVEGVKAGSTCCRATAMPWTRCCRLWGVCGAHRRA